MLHFPMTPSSQQVLQGKAASIVLTQGSLSYAGHPREGNEYLIVGCLTQSSLLKVMLWQLTMRSGPKVLRSNLTWLSARSSGTCITSTLPVKHCHFYSQSAATTATHTM